VFRHHQQCEGSFKTFHTRRRAAQQVHRLVVATRLRQALRQQAPRAIVVRDACRKTLRLSRTQGMSIFIYSTIDTADSETEATQGVSSLSSLTGAGHVLHHRPGAGQPRLAAIAACRQQAPAQVGRWCLYYRIINTHSCISHGVAT
jgi:hypothetical protein